MSERKNNLRKGGKRYSAKRGHKGTGSTAGPAPERSPDTRVKTNNKKHAGSGPGGPKEKEEVEVAPPGSFDYADDNLGSAVASGTDVGVDELPAPDQPPLWIEASPIDGAAPAPHMHKVEEVEAAMRAGSTQPQEQSRIVVEQRPAEPVAAETIFAATLKRPEAQALLHGLRTGEVTTTGLLQKFIGPNIEFSQRLLISTVLQCASNGPFPGGIDPSSIGGGDSIMTARGPSPNQQRAPDVVGANAPDVVVVPTSRGQQFQPPNSTLAALIKEKLDENYRKQHEPRKPQMAFTPITLLRKVSAPDVIAADSSGFTKHQQPAPDQAAMLAQLQSQLNEQQLQTQQQNKRMLYNQLSLQQQQQHHQMMLQQQQQQYENPGYIQEQLRAIQYKWNQQHQQVPPKPMGRPISKNSPLLAANMEMQQIQQQYQQQEMWQHRHAAQYHHMMQQHQQQQYQGFQPRGYPPPDQWRQPPNQHQLARWFSPDLLAQATAGQLPSMHVGQALRVDELERNILQPPGPLDDASSNDRPSTTE